MRPGKSWAMAAALTSGCPTALRPVAAREGLLARICVPGGVLAARQLERFAAGCAEIGIERFDITNRANIQIRGLAPKQAEAMAALARTCGLLPREHGDRRRAVVMSPLAGLELSGQEGCASTDASALVRELDTFLLASTLADALSPKFGLGVEDGGTHPIRQGSLDLVYAAEGDGWRLLLAGCDAQLRVSTERAAPVLRALLELLVETGAARVKDLLAMSGLELARSWLLESGAVEAKAAAAVRLAPPPPIGLIATADAGRVALGAIMPFGVLSMAAALAVAAIAQRSGSGEIRLTPWRGLLIPGLSRNAAADAERALAAVGLSTDPATPFAIIHACPGVQGCLRADMDVRRDALAIAEALGATGLGLRALHVSGCSRGCAWPRRADILLIADGSGGYALRRDADARAPDNGADVARALTPQDAPAAIRALADRMAAGAAGRD